MLVREETKNTTIARKAAISSAGKEKPFINNS